MSFAGVKLVTDTSVGIRPPRPTPGLIYDTKPARAVAGVLEGIIRKTTPDRGAKDNIVKMGNPSASPYRRTQYGSTPYNG
jgi:hypothetical protein